MSYAWMISVELRQKTRMLVSQIHEVNIEENKIFHLQKFFMSNFDSNLTSRHYPIMTTRHYKNNSFYCHAILYSFFEKILRLLPYRISITLINVQLLIRSFPADCRSYVMYIYSFWNDTHWCELCETISKLNFPPILIVLCGYFASGGYCTGFI